MKGLKEAAPAEVDAIIKRAYRSAAMGRVSQEDCTAVVVKATALKNLILNMEERSSE